MDWEEILLNGFEVGGTREQYEQLEYTEPVTVETKDLIDYLREQLQMMTLTPRQLLLARGVPGQHQRRGLSRRVARGDPRQRQPAGGRACRGGRRGRRRTETTEKRRRVDDFRRRGDLSVLAVALPSPSTPWPRPRRCWRSSSGSTRRASARATSASASSSSSASRPTPSRSPTGWCTTPSPT